MELTEAEAERLSRLLARAEELRAELQRLARLGIHVVTRADADYPQRYRQRLKDAAPTVLFYAGEPALLGQPGIAVVGSRHLDQAGQDCAAFVGNACGLSGLVLYSGGAKGVDTLSMNAALEVAGDSGRHPGRQPAESNPGCPKPDLHSAAAICAWSPPIHPAPAFPWARRWGATG